MTTSPPNRRSVRHVPRKLFSGRFNQLRRSILCRYQRMRTWPDERVISASDEKRKKNTGKV